MNWIYNTDRAIFQEVMILHIRKKKELRSDRYRGLKF